MKKEAVSGWRLADSKRRYALIARDCALTNRQPLTANRF